MTNMIITSDNLQGYQIVETLGLVLGVSEFKISRPRKALLYAINELIEEAKNKGANAIINFRISHAQGTEAMAIIVYGTAVKVLKENNTSIK